MSTPDQGCAHDDAVPVESAGELVAGLCPHCDLQLTEKWFSCEHDDAVEISALNHRHRQYLCPECGNAFGKDRARETWPGRML